MYTKSSYQAAQWWQSASHGATRGLDAPEVNPGLLAIRGLGISN
jgi:hypothetical protein